VFAPHTGDSSFIVGTEIYLANDDMVSNISSDINKEFFVKIMEMADENQYNTKYRQGNGWQEIVNHYAECYDRIKFDVVNVVIREYQDSEGISDDEREESRNEILSEMMKDLLVPCLPGILKLFVCNVISGFIITVLKVHKYLNVMAFFLYMAYIVVLVWLVKNKSYKKLKNSVVPFAILVLLAIALNVGITSATIYCQMRYMLYNTAFFYQAGLLMLIEAGHIIKEK
jgi:cation transport ATPase